MVKRIKRGEGGSKGEMNFIITSAHTNCIYTHLSGKVGENPKAGDADGLVVQPQKVLGEREESKWRLVVC